MPRYYFYERVPLDGLESTGDTEPMEQLADLGPERVKRALVTHLSVVRALLRAPLGPGLRTSRDCGQAAGLLSG